LKCVCANKLYVNMSWIFFHQNKEDLFVKIVEDKALLQNKKILKKINAKTKQKTQYLLSKIKESNIFEFFNYLVANIFVKLSFIFWLSFAMLDNLSNVNKIIE